MAHHIDPPARQQMILDGVKALYRISGSPAPTGLSRRVSAVTAPGQLEPVLAELWPKSMAKPVAVTALEDAMIEGMLANVPGGAFVMSSKESAVMEQFEGNRYVGIHIALGINDAENRPGMFEVIEGGPADQAGVKKGDVLDAIDGVDTKGMALREAVDRLRRARRIQRDYQGASAQGGVANIHDQAWSARAYDRRRRSQTAYGRLGLSARSVRSDCLPANHAARREHAE